MFRQHCFELFASLISNAPHMRPYISRIIVSSLVLLSTLSFAADNAGNRVIAEALKPSSLENNLRHLTDEIGGRVPGTPGMEAGVAWGVSAFKAAGADSVHTEDFTIPHSWAE